MVDNEPKNLRQPGESDEDLLSRLFAEQGITLKKPGELIDEVNRLSDILERVEPVEKRLNEVFDAPLNDRQRILKEILDEELGNDQDS